MALWKPNHAYKTPGPSSRMSHLLKHAALGGHLPVQVVQLVASKAGWGGGAAVDEKKQQS